MNTMSTLDETMMPLVLSSMMDDALMMNEQYDRRRSDRRRLEAAIQRFVDTLPEPFPDLVKITVNADGKITAERRMTPAVATTLPMTWEVYEVIESPAVAITARYDNPGVTDWPLQNQSSVMKNIVGNRWWGDGLIMTFRENAEANTQTWQDTLAAIDQTSRYLLRHIDDRLEDLKDMWMDICEPSLLTKEKDRYMAYKHAKAPWLSERIQRMYVDALASLPERLTPEGRKLLKWASRFGTLDLSRNLPAWFNDVHFQDRLDYVCSGMPAMLIHHIGRAIVDGDDLDHALDTWREAETIPMGVAETGSVTYDRLLDAYDYLRWMTEQHEACQRKAALAEQASNRIAVTADLIGYGVDIVTAEVGNRTLWLSSPDPNDEGWHIENSTVRGVRVRLPASAIIRKVMCRSANEIAEVIGGHPAIEWLIPEERQAVAHLINPDEPFAVINAAHW